MTMKEAMQARHTVRTYTDKPLPDDIIEKLNERIRENNEKSGLDIKLITGDPGAFDTLYNMILAKGVKNYFIMCGDDTTELDEKCGWCGADLMLYAQTLGLNTWWVSSTFNRKKTADAAGGKKIVGIIAVGYGQTQGVPHKSKKAQKVSSYEGDAPPWFKEGVAAALLAPTAINRQAFFIKGKGSKVSITCNNGIYTGADLGLVKYHFELGAGKENFEWA